MAMMDYPHHYSTNFDYPSYPTARSSTPSTGCSIDGSYPVAPSYDDYYSGPRPPVQQQQPRKFSAHPLQLTTVGASDVSQQLHDDAEYTAHPSRPQPPNPFHGHHQPTVPSNAHPQQQQRDGEHVDYRRSGSFESRSGEIISQGGSAGASGFSRPLNHHEQERIAHLDRLKFFLATAPSRWDANNADSTSSSDIDNAVSSSSTASTSTVSAGHSTSSHPALNRFLLPSAEYVSCVLWNGLYHITGTDIVRALVFRFEAFGRPVRNMKKFEEGVFSDLRNLKPGVDACLEEPKSPFLDLLFKYQCIRTQKKQKVFYWFSVPHDRLFLDALERDLKREKMGLEPTTVITGEPALSFVYDSKKSLYEQFSKASGGREGEGELEAAVRRADEAAAGIMHQQQQGQGEAYDDDEMNLIQGNGDEEGLGGYYPGANAYPSQPGQARSATLPPALHGPNSTFYNMFSLFEGSPTYKQRRKKPTQPPPRGGVPGMRRSPGSDGDWGSGAEGSVELAAGAGYGPSDGNVNAADMFLKQAKGEFGPGSGKVRRKEDGAHQRHNSYPSTSSSIAHTHPAPYHAMTYPVSLNASAALSMPHAHSPAPSMSSVSSHSGAHTTGSPRSKAFMCPLYSCSRLFKRAEHLKRHLRAHSSEKPYVCARCDKRFVRADNLNMHSRTHRDISPASSGLELNMALGTDNNTYEGEDDAHDNYRAMASPDIERCEVDVDGAVRDVQGDEEGLVTQVASDAYAQPSHYFPQQQMGPQAGAYSSWSAPGTSRYDLQNSIQPSQNHHLRHSDSTSSLYAASVGSLSDSEFAMPMSAPAHKHMFDHSSLYPPSVGVSLASPSGSPSSLNGGLGPIRRHRSMTPSLHKSNEGGLRRPMTSAHSEYSSVGVSRGYHPYAVPASYSSSSAQSSPASYPIPLDYQSTGNNSGNLSRSSSISHHSRSSRNSGVSQQLQDQMHQMLNLDMEDPMYTHTNAAAASYRTDSPVSFGASAQGYINEDGFSANVGNGSVDPTFFSQSL